MVVTMADHRMVDQRTGENVVGGRQSVKGQLISTGRLVGHRRGHSSKSKAWKLNQNFIREKCGHFHSFIGSLDSEWRGYRRAYTSPRSKKNDRFLLISIHLLTLVARRWTGFALEINSFVHHIHQLLFCKLNSLPFALLRIKFFYKFCTSDFIAFIAQEIYIAYINSKFVEKLDLERSEFDSIRKRVNLNDV